MKKRSKYEELCIIFLKRLILIEREIFEFQDNIPNDNKKIIRVYIENNELIPISEIDNILGITNDNLGELLYEDLSKIIEKCPIEILEKETAKILEKYVNEI